jgi:uncharacterized protein (TIGR02646 family)
MALKRVSPPYTLTVVDQQAVSGILANQAKPWELNRLGLKSLRSSIRAHLETVQNYRCCYCGLSLGETSAGEIDHVAPQSIYPQFSYEPQNLVLACDYCNGFQKKKQEDTIVPVVTSPYNANAFTIVHPVLEQNINAHIQVSRGVVKGLTTQGIESIRLFGLDNERQTQARRKAAIQDRLDALPPRLKELLYRVFRI